MISFEQFLYRKDHENCRVQLLVVAIFHKLKQKPKMWQWCGPYMCSWTTSLIMKA